MLILQVLVLIKSSFFRYIPIELRLLNKKHLEHVSKFQETFKMNVDNFYEQFIMNNPDMASWVDLAAFKALHNPSTVTRGSNDELIYSLPKGREDLMIAGSIDDLVSGNKSTSKLILSLSVTSVISSYTYSNVLEKDLIREYQH